MKGWRTIFLNVATAVASEGAAIADVVPNSNVEHVGVIIAIINIILRIITTTSVGRAG